MNKKSDKLILLKYYLKSLYFELDETWFWQRKKRKELRLEIYRILNKISINLK
jgi:hypothetical protein